MGDDKDEFITQLQDDLNLQKTKNLQLAGSISAMSYPQQDSNSIEFQLEAEQLLFKIENFLKGARRKTDGDGNETWEVPADKGLTFLNEYGVNSIMIIISQYIDKNTMLSNYTEERINEILADLGDELSYYFFNNYEKMGMDDDFKKSRYPLTVLTILHSIESAYRKAIRGQTSENINTSKIYTQSDLTGAGRTLTSTPQKKKFNLFKISTW